MKGNTLVQKLMCAGDCHVINIRQQPKYRLHGFDQFLTQILQ